MRLPVGKQCKHVLKMSSTLFLEYEVSLLVSKMLSFTEVHGLGKVLTPMKPAGVDSYTAQSLVEHYEAEQTTIKHNIFK